ncbi:MAG: YdcF family protein [Hydrogenothermaceae bacterium]|nr:YdcF family protein [Hydrogenothermaceae bacterium]
MFFLKKLITFMILPPGIFVILFLSIAFLRKKMRLASVISVASAVSIYLLSIEPIKDLLLSPLEEKYKRPKQLTGDVIVVLGGGSYNTGVLTDDSLKRLLTGFILQKQLNIPIILSGGSAIINLPESEVMKSVLIELGVDRSQIFTDVSSRDTLGNAFFTKKICQSKGFRRVILVTSAYHMPRSILTFKQAGIEVIPYSTDFKMDKRYTFYSYLPKMNVLQDSTKVLREYIGLVSYYFHFKLFK